jgi:hypothetical protein
MRKLLGAALAASSLLFVAPHAAQASVECHRVAVDDKWVDVCAGSWCPDECFVVAYVDCNVPLKLDPCPIGFTR